MADLIERTVDMSCNGEDGYVLDFVYSTDIPDDVLLRIEPGNAWTFPLQTLTEGLDVPSFAPAGDVLVQPFEEQVLIDLMGEWGICRLAFRRLDVVMFLADIQGAPARDWDAEFVRLLDGAL